MFHWGPAQIKMSVMLVCALSYENSYLRIGNIGWKDIKKFLCKTRQPVTMTSSTRNGGNKTFWAQKIALKTLMKFEEIYTIL